LFLDVIAFLFTKITLCGVFECRQWWSRWLWNWQTFRVNFRL